MDTATPENVTPRWAPAETLAGRLQRGTGAGYLQALEVPRAEARSLLLDCLLRDPRWDRQLESRAPYYAALVGELELGSAALCDQLRCADRSDEATTDLLLETLGELARRGDSDALTGLVECLKSGNHWRSALEALVECGKLAALPGLDRLVCDRFSDARELRWVVSDREPWLTWSRTNARIATALRRSAEAQDRVYAEQSPERFAGLTVSQLFDQVTHRDWVAVLRALRAIVGPGDVPFLATQLNSRSPSGCRLALHGLGRVGDAAAFEAWREFVERHPELPPMLRSVVHQAARNFRDERAQEIGRAWLEHPDHLRQQLGESLLAQTATLADLGRLCGIIEPALESGDMYRLCGAAEGLRRIGSPAAWPELARAFPEAPYSYARYELTRAMVSCDPARFAAELAGASLWDCEPDVRKIACGAVDRSAPAVRERLAFLAADRFEEEGVRDAAALL